MTAEPDIYLRASLVGGLPTVTFPPRPYHRRVTNIVVGNGVASNVTVYRGQLGSTPVAQNSNGQTNTLSGSISLPAGQQLFVQWNAAASPVSSAFARASFERSDSPLGDVPDTQSWSENIVTQLIVGDAANGEAIITQGVTAALADYYTGYTLGAVLIRLMPPDGSYFYIVAGIDPSGHSFGAMGNVKAGALVAADVSQAWYSYFDPGANISQFNLGDLSHDQRMLINTNFIEVGNGLRGDVTVDGVLRVGNNLGINGEALTVYKAGEVNPRISFGNQGNGIAMGDGTANQDAFFYRLAAGLFGVSSLLADINGTPETWHQLALINGWTQNYVNNFQIVPSPNNSVYIRASFNVPAAARADATQICTMPVGYRPAEIMDIPATCDAQVIGKSPHFSINTTGVVTCWGLSNATLASISAVYSMDS